MWWLIVVPMFVGIWLGWIWKAAEARREVILKGRDAIIFDGFDRYLEITDELHPQDPRNAILKVVDISQN